MSFLLCIKILARLGRRNKLDPVGRDRVRKCHGYREHESGDLDVLNVELKHLVQLVVSSHWLLPSDFFSSPNCKARWRCLGTAPSVIALAHSSCYSVSLVFIDSLGCKRFIWMFCVPQAGSLSLHSAISDCKHHFVRAMFDWMLFNGTQHIVLNLFWTLDGLVLVGRDNLTLIGFTYQF